MQGLVDCSEDSGLHPGALGGTMGEWGRQEVPKSTGGAEVGFGCEPAACLALQIQSVLALFLVGVCVCGALPRVLEGSPGSPQNFGEKF